MEHFGGTHTWLRRVVGSAVPLLLVVGGVSVAVVSGGGGGSASVAALQAPAGAAAAGETGAEAPVPVPTTAAVTTTTKRPAPTTTVARSALVFEAPPITQALPASTRPTAPTSTAAPVTAPVTAPTTTTTTFPANAAIVTIVNNYGGGVLLDLNGVRYDLEPGQRLVDVPVIPGPSGNDTFTLVAKLVPACGVGDADNLFLAGQRFTFTIVTGQGDCVYGNPGPAFVVTPTLA
ncbi:MAG: hypothetical protein ACRD2W_19280 [Acidimicrobiales bacterium]